MKRKFTLAALAVTAAAVGAIGIATPASAAASHGCPSGYVCVYLTASWNGDKPSHKYYTYGIHSLPIGIGYHRVFNNQTGGAKARVLDLGYHPSRVIAAGDVADIDISRMSYIELLK